MTEGHVHHYLISDLFRSDIVFIHGHVKSGGVCMEYDRVTQVILESLEAITS